MSSPKFIRKNGKIIPIGPKGGAKSANNKVKKAKASYEGQKKETKEQRNKFNSSSKTTKKLAAAGLFSMGASTTGALMGNNKLAIAGIAGVAAAYVAMKVSKQSSRKSLTKMDASYNKQTKKLGRYGGLSSAAAKFRKTSV